MDRGPDEAQARGRVSQLRCVRGSGFHVLGRGFVPPLHLFICPDGSHLLFREQSSVVDNHATLETPLEVSESNDAFVDQSRDPFLLLNLLAGSLKHSTWRAHQQTGWTSVDSHYFCSQLVVDGHGYYGQRREEVYINVDYNKNVAGVGSGAGGLAGLERRGRFVRERRCVSEKVEWEERGDRARAEM